MDMNIRGPPIVYGGKHDRKLLSLTAEGQTPTEIGVSTGEKAVNQS